jgi:hypothetical protein
MRTKLLVLFVVLVIGFAFPVTAIAGSLTLHPAGFGEKSRSNWWAQQGLPDNTGNGNQALYFQKMTATTTFAAGAAVIRGLEGRPLTDLTGLAWDHRTDGHCGAGAPRWNVNLKDSLGQSQTVFLGCNAAVHTVKAGTTNGHTWCTDTFPAGTAIAGMAGGVPPFTIRSLVIIFDEGNDTPNPPPAVCAQEQLVGGFIFLDNITVELNGTPHVWTSASDNGNINAYSPGFGAQVAFADELVPAADILATLVDALPEVSLTSWVLYPDVDLTPVIAIPTLP